MEIGIFEWFDESKGFGILKTPENKEVFIHKNNWKDNITISNAIDLPILFDITFQRNKDTATNCKIFNPKTPNHWEKLFSLNDFAYLITARLSRINIVSLILKKLPIDIECLKKCINSKYVEVEIEEVLNKDFILNQIYNYSMNDEICNFIIQKVENKLVNLETQVHLDYWRNKVLKNYTPKRDFLTNCFNYIELPDFKNIHDETVKNEIVLLKIKELCKIFSISKFNEFENILNYITDLGLKEKLISELNKIAEQFYLNAIQIEIQILTDKTDLKYYEITSFLNKTPKILNSEIYNNAKNIIRNNIIANCEFKIILEAWEDDLIEKLPPNVIDKIPFQTIEDLTHLLKISKIEESIVVCIFDHFLEINEFKLLLNFAKKNFNNLFNYYDNKIFNITPKEIYFELWKNQYGAIFPKEYLINFFDDKIDKYYNSKYWVINKLTSNTELIEIFYSVIDKHIEIESRKDFHTVSNSILTILELNEFEIEIIKGSNNDFFNLILWHNKKSDIFNFETLQGKYIYFKPLEQVSIFKRLFYLKQNKKIDFTINELDNLLRADLDMFLTNEKFNSDFVIDISTHIIIEGIKSYIKKGNFIFESDYILKDLQRNSKKRFHIENYFDKCKGRSTPEWNWRTNGNITKVFYPNDANQFYYAIEIPLGEEVERNNYYGSYTVFEKNPNFEYLKEAVKKLPERKWNPTLNHWGVKSIYKNQVYEFAKHYSFFIKLSDNKHYDNNLHLVEYTRYIREDKKKTNEINVPIGITYCEGRKANNLHEKHQIDFWWCCNQECFHNSIENHLKVEEVIENSSNLFLITEISTEPQKDIWESYTLLDFLNILNINTNEFNGLDYIENGEYFKFLGHINAFNRLLKHLYCEECNSLLYPKNTSHFALFTDVRFYCIEETCSKKHFEIYLNNCSYGECKTIIDSRVSKQCEHDLYICHNCGTCCSIDFFKRRLENLKLTGGYIHPDLILNVEEKNGHLDRKEYYCYKCAGMMKQTEEKKFSCKICEVEYDLNKFKWLNRKWTQIFNRRKDYPV